MPVGFPRSFGSRSVDSGLSQRTITFGRAASSADTISACAGPPVCEKSCAIHPEWRSRTCSARHTKYGIQPMSPSVSENFKSGKRSQKSAQMSSPNE